MPRSKPQPSIVRKFSDVFVAVHCSRCGEKVLRYEGHASEFQQMIFHSLREHKLRCQKILKLFPEIAQ